MKFICNENKFLSNMINMKKLEEITFTFKVNGKIKMFTNYEALSHFFEYGNKSQFKEVQLILNRSKFGIKSINDFAYQYGMEMFK